MERAGATADTAASTTGRGTDEGRVSPRPLSIKLLGHPEVSLEGRPFRFGRKKALALLCYLAAEGGKHPRRELAEFFWPDSEERHARTDLRSVLSKLRKALEGNGTVREAHDDSGSFEEVRLLVVEGDLLWLQQPRVELDLRTLEAAVELARGGTSGNPLGDGHAHDTAKRRDLTARLEEALRVHRGDFMEGFFLEDAPEFELWLEAERARWREIFGELCERVSRLQSEAGRLEAAIRTTRLWTRHAPLEEPAHLRLAELLSSSGDSEGALTAYEDFRRALRRGLEIEPSPRMANLAERLRKEIDERAFLGAGLVRSSTSASPSALDVPFAGRGEEFGALVSEFHAALAGETRSVALLGEAGIGKTRLGEEFLGWARGRGADILKGEASEGARLPYGPLVEALRPRMEKERAPDDLLEDVWLSELSRLLPELKERYPDLPATASGEAETAKGALFEAIARMVEALASRAPVVLFLDDLQWADAATLEVLDYAGRRWAEQQAPVLVLVAARPEEPDSGSSIKSWILSSRRRLVARNLSLGPLENQDIEALLRRLARVTLEPMGVPEQSGKQPGVSDRARSELERFGTWLAVETGGQPFYFVETLKALLEEGKLELRDHPDGGSVLEVGGPAWSGPLPSSVRDVIRGRLSRLSPAASDLLAAGAVLGRGFDFEPLVGVAGLGQTEGLRGLEELTGRRLLLEETGGGDEGRAILYPGPTYSFSHEKIRQVAYTEAGQARRWVLHRRAFEVLEGRGAPIAQLARHALAAGLVNETFKYSLAAGDAAAEVFAVRDAIVHYERAREVLNAGGRSGGKVEPSIPDVRRIYTQLGWAYEMADQWGKAREAYETMLAFAREAGGARLRVVSLNHLAVFLFHHEGDLPGAKALLEDARSAAEEAGLAEVLAETECNLVEVTALQTSEFEGSRPLAEKALASARALERPDLVARAVATLARLKTFAGPLEEAAAHAEEGARISRELAEKAASARTGFPSVLIGVRGVSASWRAGNKAMEIRCLTYLALVRIFQGRPREGIAIARELGAISVELPERVESLSLYALGMGLQEVGEYEEGLELARRGTQRAREVRDMYLLGVNLARLGDAHVALLNLAEARGLRGGGGTRTLQDIFQRQVVRRGRPLRGLGGGPRPSQKSTRGRHVLQPAAQHPSPPRGRDASARRRRATRPRRGAPARRACKDERAGSDVLPSRSVSPELEERRYRKCCRHTA